MDELAGFDPYDSKMRNKLQKEVLSRVQNEWFTNYEANLPLIKKWGGIENMPLSPKFLIVGAGWPLWDGKYAQKDKMMSVKGNQHILEKVKCPVIVCDKIAPTAARYVKPFAVTALNTASTDVSIWMSNFRRKMKERWGNESTKDVWLIVPVTVNPEALNNWDGKMAFINPENTCEELIATVFKETGLEPRARGDNVGYFSIIMAISLGAKEITIIGMPYSHPTEDAAMDATKGRHCVTLYDAILRAYVYTTFDWIDSRRELMEVLAKCKEEHGINFFNSTGAGILYQAGVMEPLDFEEWVKHSEG
ncbi:MAG: hypothetical protein PHG80_12245 [Methanoregulaceae archaeon]|nr:hypothetical protein [Methanoregulaceae archaeon]